MKSYEKPEEKPSRTSPEQNFAKAWVVYRECDDSESEYPEHAHILRHIGTVYATV